MVVDFHTHTFPDAIAGNVIQKLSKDARACAFSDATLHGLKASMKEAFIDLSVLLPIATNPGQTEKLNTLAIQTNEMHQGKEIISLGTIHPENKNYKEELRRIKENGLKGLKIHPQYQNYYFDSPEFLRIISYAAELGLFFVVHAGIDIGIPTPTKVTPENVLTVLKEAAPYQLILAHMGGWKMWDEVEDVLCGAPVYFDTSYSLGLIGLHPSYPRTPAEQLLMQEEQFLRIVKKHGANHILFGTDSPWHSQSEAKQLIEHLPLSDSEKQQILGRNAEKILEKP